MSDIYKIGVAIMLTDGMSPILSLISHRLLGVHKSVGQINSGIGKWKTGLLGVAGVIAGGAIIGGMVKIAEHGEKFLSQQAALKNLGLTNLQIAQATAKAWENTRNAPGSTVDKNLKAIGEMNAPLGFTEALKVSTKIAQVDQILSSITGKEGQAYEIVKSAELLGKFQNPQTHEFNMEGFGKFLDIVVKSSEASHGKVGPADWLAYAKQGNVAAGGFTEEGMLTAATTMQAMGGHRAGTASQALVRQIVGGVMARRVAEELIKVGILDGGGVHYKKGGAVVIDDGAMKGVEQLQKDQLSFFTDVVLPAWTKAGIDTPEKQAKEFYRSFGTGPTQRLAFELIRGQYQIKAERGRLAGGADVASATSTLNTLDPIQVKKDFWASLDNMLTALGSPLLAASIPFMNALTKVMNDITAFAAAHPRAILDLSLGIVALGAAFVATGMVAIASAIGVGGWMIAGFAALGATFAVLEKYKDKLFPNTGAAGTPNGPAKNMSDWWNNYALPFLAPSHTPAIGHGSAVPPAANSNQSSNGDIYMDGKKVGEIVNRHNAMAMNGPLQGSAYFDGSMTMASVDYGLARG